MPTWVNERLRGVQLPLTGMEQAALVSQIHRGGARLISEDSERVSVWAASHMGMMLKVVFDRKTESIASVLEIEERDLGSCDCGHKHCHQLCNAVHVRELEALLCRCSKCACPLCERYWAARE